MKKIKLFAVSIVLALLSTNAFAQAFEEGTKVGAIGIGWPNIGKLLYAADFAGSGTDYKATGFGPLHGRFEFGLTDRFGLGVSINFVTYGAKWTDVNGIYNSTTGLYTTGNYEIKTTALAFLVRGNRHWDVNDKVDIFSGFGIGYGSRKTTLTSNDPNWIDDNTTTYENLIPIAFEWTLGMRYYFNDNIGFYIEGGYAKDILQGGIVAKF